MKQYFVLLLILIALLACQSGLASEANHHKVDVCVYGGTGSGAMAALAADKEGAKVILIEPSRWLGGMTGGGINHLDWGKGNTVGGSTYKILMEGLEVQDRSTMVGMPDMASATGSTASASRSWSKTGASP